MPTDYAGEKAGNIVYDVFIFAKPKSNCGVNKLLVSLWMKTSKHMAVFHHIVVQGK